MWTPPTTTAAVASCSASSRRWPSSSRELIRERTMAGLKAARARGRKGGRKFALSKAQVRLAPAAMAHRDTSLSDLCVDRDPVSGERLASQPTLSRFENGVSRSALLSGRVSWPTGSSRGIAAGWMGGRGASDHHRSEPDRRPDARRTAVHAVQPVLRQLVLPAAARLRALRPRAVPVCGAAAARQGGRLRRGRSACCPACGRCYVAHFRGRGSAFDSTGALQRRRSSTSWRPSRGSTTWSRWRRSCCARRSRPCWWRERGVGVANRWNIVLHSGGARVPPQFDVGGEPHGSRLISSRIQSGDPP